MSSYRNKHTGDVVTIVDGTMREGSLYAYAGNADTYKLAFGLEGRDGTTFDTRHWQRMADNPALAALRHHVTGAVERGEATAITEQLACQSALDAHHSSDIVDVFHGKAEPRVLCGYHAMREGFTS